ncbi:MAG: hypothetical protein V2A66_01945 [Pseudomonadota bacterium]
MQPTFDHILLLGRPAAGKSEFIDFMKKTPDEERASSFHIGRFEELDDFIWLWEKFLEDNMWEDAGYGRIYSQRYGNNYGLDPKAEKLYDLMMVRFNLEARERYITKPAFYKDGTLIIEFSRGGKEGYLRTLPRLSKEILERAAILYLKVSFEESWRRNVARYEETLRHSILAHMVPRETLEHFYSKDDWETMTSGKEEGHLEINGIKVPFVTMENEPELKEHDALTARYRPALAKLMKIYEAGR